MELLAKRRRLSKSTNANYPSKKAKSEVKTEHGNGSIKCGRYILRLTKERLQQGTPSSPPVSTPQGASKLHSPAYSAHSSSGENQVELPVRRFGKALKVQLQFRKHGHVDSGGNSSKKTKLVGIDTMLHLTSETSFVHNKVEQRLKRIMHKEKGKGVVEIEDDDPYHLHNIAQDQMLKLKAHFKSGQYSAGIAKLSDPIWTSAFIRSPPEFQLDMLQSLCPVNPQPPQFRGQHPPYPYPYPTWLPPFTPDLLSQNAAPFLYKFPSANQPTFPPNYPTQNQPTFPPSYPAQNPMGFPNSWGNLQQPPVTRPTRLPFTKPF